MKRKLLCLFAVISLFTLLQAQPSYVFDSLYENLVSLGQKPDKQFLVDSILVNIDDDKTDSVFYDGNKSNGFPYNIIVSIDGNGEYPLQKLIVSLPPSLSFESLTIINSFINSLKETPPQYNIDFLFSANDESLIPSDSQSESIPSGIATYIQNFSDDESLVSLILKEEEGETSIIPGANGKVAPSRYLSSLLTSFEKQKVKVNLRGGFLSLYRLKLLDSFKPITYFMSQNIPSIAVTYNQDSINTILSVLDDYIRYGEVVDSTKWDNQYSLFKVGSYHLVIHEHILILFFLLFLAISLFTTCGFSFVFSKLSIQRKTEFKKTWYLVPLCIFVVGIFLLLMQKLTIAVLPSWNQKVITSFTLKIMLSFFLLTLFSLVTYKISFPLTAYIWGYLLLLSAIINVFVFTVCDLELFILFFLHFIIVLISRPLKKVSSLVITLIFQIVPFGLCFVLIDEASRYQVFSNFVSCSFLTDLLLAALLTPIVFMWLRIRVRLKLLGKNDVDKKRKLILFIVSISIYFLLILFVSILFDKSHYVEEQRKIESVKDTSYVKIHVDDAISFSDRANISVTIESSLPVIRYEVKIVSIESDLAVFSSNYPYDAFSDIGKAIYKLDDYPPNPFVLNCVVDNKQTIYLRLSAYLNYPNDRIVVDKRVLLLHKGQDLDE